MVIITFNVSLIEKSGMKNQMVDTKFNKAKNSVVVKSEIKDEIPKKNLVVKRGYNDAKNALVVESRIKNVRCTNRGRVCKSMNECCKGLSCDYLPFLGFFCL